MTKSSSPKASKWDWLPHDVMKDIASRLDNKDQSTLRAVSKGTRQSIVDPFAKERGNINKLVKLFKKGQSSCENGANVCDNEGAYGIYAYEGDKIAWRVILEYDTGNHYTSWNYLTVCKLGDDRVIEGAIRLDFWKRRLHSYKTGDKIWLIAFFLTVIEWMRKDNKYKQHLRRNKAFMQWVDKYGQQYWRYIYTSDKILEFARLVWSLEAHEDNTLARDLVTNYNGMSIDTSVSSNRSNRSRSSPVAHVDEGRTITLRMREASKKREAFLNEGMLGHSEAVAKFLTKKGSRKKGKQ